eukprot:GHVL01017713.1.p1 GENE.GHVL01017713.1~~GHVL01017713.1.p1  ORF type:complete len:664 (+),score=130.38 GHVL01017713.1:67-2058(+)
MAGTYRFKDITVVPNAADFVDIVLNKTQRKTPTVVHPQYNIHRIRRFYMRKIKYAMSTFSERCKQIITEFPRLEDIHPFYGDLMNVLYDKDHYKLALGQVNSIKNVIERIARDYVRMMKYADSAYKNKMLKRAGLGRMCTAVKRLAKSLIYLEEVRQHLSRLPQINPSSKTLMLCGYPNVGKSSFMNLITNANVEVQPYAFTTKSLFVGHFDYNFSRWQAVDTPGILDRPLESRNTIEMSAITALAHISSAVLYFIDITETCGYSINEQVGLFTSIKPLFKNKPLIVVLNKIDMKPLTDLTSDELASIKSIEEDNPSAVILPISCTSTEGVDECKNKACEVLIQHRLEHTAPSKLADRIDGEIQITGMTPPKERPPCIPASVLRRRRATTSETVTTCVTDTIDDESDDEDMNPTFNDENMEETARLERDLEMEGGGPGVYSVDHRKNHILNDSSWKYDVLPEVFDGKNVMDFVCPEIEAKLIALEKEEETLEAEDLAKSEFDATKWTETQAVLDRIHKKIALARVKRQMYKPRTVPILPRSAARGRKTVTEVADHLKTIGYDTKAFIENARPDRRPSSLLEAGTASLKRRRSSMAAIYDEKNMTLAQMNKKIAYEEKGEKLKRQKTKRISREARKGEADRHISNFMPKHMNSGKRKSGKTDRR